MKKSKVSEYISSETKKIEKREKAANKNGTIIALLIVTIVITSSIAGYYTFNWAVDYAENYVEELKKKKP